MAGTKNEEHRQAALNLLLRHSTATSSTELIAGLLASINELIPSTSLAFNEVDLVSDRVRGLTHPPEILEQWRNLDLFDRWMHQNPIISELNETFHQRAVRWSDHDIEHFKTTELYHQFMAPNGVEYQMGFGLPGRSGFLRGIVMNRADRDFTDSERDLATEISATTAILIRVSAQRASAFVEKVSSPDWTVLLVDHAGTVLSEPNADGSHSAELAPTFVAWVRAALDDRNILSQLEVRQAIVADEAGRPFNLRLVPDVAGSNLLIIAGQDLPVWVTDRLTERQRDVLERLVAGGTNDRIARALGISVETVKKHLTQIYRALGVADRTSAIVAVRSEVPVS